MSNVDYEELLKNAAKGLDAVDKLCKRDMIETYYVVGGFLRDLHTGKPYRDIDVFIPGTKTVPEGSEELEYDLSNNYSEDFEGFEINLIFMQGAHTVKSLVDRCDLGICQIGIDKYRTLYMSEYYKEDVAKKTLTLLRDTRKNHVDKVRDKFKDYTFISNNWTMTGEQTCLI